MIAGCLISRSPLLWQLRGATLNPSIESLFGSKESDFFKQGLLSILAGAETAELTLILDLRGSRDGLLAVWVGQA